MPICTLNDCLDPSRPRLELLPKLTGGNNGASNEARLERKADVAVVADGGGGGSKMPEELRRLPAWTLNDCLDPSRPRLELLPKLTGGNNGASNEARPERKADVADSQSIRLTYILSQSIKLTYIRPLPFFSLSHYLIIADVTQSPSHPNGLNSC